MSIFRQTFKILFFLFIIFWLQIPNEIPIKQFEIYDCTTNSLITLATIPDKYVRCWFVPDSLLNHYDNKICVRAKGTNDYYSEFSDTVAYRFENYCLKCHTTKETKGFNLK